MKSSPKIGLSPVVLMFCETDINKGAHHIGAPFVLVKKLFFMQPQDATLLDSPLDRTDHDYNRQ